MEERGQNKLTAKIIAFIGSSFSNPKFVLSYLRSSLLTLTLAPHVLPDHPVRPRQHIRRNRQADLFCRLQIDDELKLCRLLDRQVGRLRAFQYFIYISSG